MFWDTVAYSPQGIPFQPYDFTCISEAPLFQTDNSHFSSGLTRLKNTDGFIEISQQSEYDYMCFVIKGSLQMLLNDERFLLRPSQYLEEYAGHSIMSSITSLRFSGLGRLILIRI